MTETLGDLLRRTADAVAEPRLDVNALVAQTESRVRRRRVAVTSTTVGLVAAVVVGVFAARADQPRELEPAPSPSPSPSRAVDTTGTRPLVYAEGRTVHVGDRTVEAEEPVGFVDATDDGAVFEATLDHTLWFTDGTTTTAIGTTPYTAAPTAHSEVTTGDSGSLVVWGDLSGRLHRLPVELVVFDTSRLEEVGRIAVVGDYSPVLYVDDDQVYFNPDPDTPGCWVLEIQDIHHCPNPHLLRFDVSSGETTKIKLAELHSALGSRSRVFVVQAPTGNDLGFVAGANFTQVGRRLVPADRNGELPVLVRTNGDEVQLRLPSGYTSPGPTDESGGVTLSQWLDDDHVVLWASDGGGDLPAKRGDLLVCRLPDGVCRVAVPRSSHDYVAPYRSSE